MRGVAQAVVVSSWGKWEMKIVLSVRGESENSKNLTPASHCKKTKKKKERN